MIIARLFILMILSLGFTFPSRAADRLTESEVLRAVLRDNPAIKSAQAKWETMKQRIPQARAWEDPMAGADIERMGTTRLNTFSDIEYMLSQVVPVSGKNVSRGRVANGEAAAAFEDVRRVELDAVSRARAAYSGLAAAHAQLGITAENETLLKQFTDISRVKYEAGLQSQSDVLLAQVESAKIAQTQANLEREVSDRESELNVLMNRSARSSLGAPTPLRFKPLQLSVSAVESLALANRPELQRAQKSIETEQARLQLAHREWIPDPQFRMEARQFRETSGRGISEYDTGIFFSVPWVNYRKYNAVVKEAQSSVQAAQNDLVGARTQTLGLVRDQLKKIETAARNYTLFQEKLVPLARQTIESTRAGYESDKTGFLEVLTARRALQEAQSMAIEQLGLHQIAIAELRAIIGVDPSALTSTARTRAKTPKD